MGSMMQVVNKTSETKLMQMIGSLRGQAIGWQVIHFHLSDLLDEYKSEYQVKIALNLIHDLLKTHDGSIFVLGDNSLIVVCYKLDNLLREKLIFQLRYLYMDDPLCYDESGQENPDFCSHYDLVHDWREVELLAANYMAVMSRKQGGKTASDVQLETALMEPRRRTAKQRQDQALQAPRMTLDPIDSLMDDTITEDGLLSVEHMLRNIDMRSVTRRQPVCAVLPDMKVRRVFDELYIHIAHLRRMVKSEVDFFSNRWLFKYLTTILDQRMIELISSNPNHYLSSPVSINLNVETLLSPWFARFDAQVKPAAKVSMVIEVPVIDLFADMHAFNTAMAEAQRLGYRVCLDGLSTESFLSIDREKIGLDLIKVQWNADIITDLKSKENAPLIAAVNAIGTNRLILCRCDNRNAIEYGKALGISLFQGRYLDSVLNPTLKVEN